MGGGFAGCAAARYFGTLKGAMRDKIEIVLFDPKHYSEFIPMLPDIISGKVSPGTLRCPLQEVCGPAGISFINARVDSIDTSLSRVCYGEESIDYSHLLLCPGSGTDFYGNDDFAEKCFTIDSVENAVSLRNELIERAGRSENTKVLVVGGGYTGLETACSIRSLFDSMGKNNSIVLAERSSSLLGAAPPWLGSYAENILKTSGIEVFTGVSLENIDKNRAGLSNGRVLEDTVVIWTAGVKPPSIVEDIPAEKIRSRLKVENNLAVRGVSSGGRIFAAGDSAAFYCTGAEIPLRQAVMFAISQGKKAARNIVRDIVNKPLDNAVMNDLGYVIPLVRKKAPGVVMGIRIPPRLGFFLHYFMCFYRLPLKGKIRLLKDMCPFHKREVF